MDESHERTAESSGASPADAALARSVKRAAIQKQVDERRRQMAEEKLKGTQLTFLNANFQHDDLLSPSAILSPDRDDAASTPQSFTTQSVGVSERAGAQFAAASSDGQASQNIVEVFPAPRLSPSQKRALDRHQLRLLRGRANRDLWNEEEMLEWHKSLRNLSSQVSMDVTNDPTQKFEQPRHQQQLQHQSDQHANQQKTSPLSKNFEEVIGSVRNRLFRGQELGRDASVSPIGHLMVQTPARPSSLNRSPGVDASPLARRHAGNTSRQLDFDSTAISFESSPLRMRNQDPFAAVYDWLLLSQSPDFLACSRMMIYQHVSLLPLRIRWLRVMFLRRYPSNKKNFKHC